MKIITGTLFFFLVCGQIANCQVVDAFREYNEKTKTEPYKQFSNKVNKEVNYHTGTVNVGIPLYEIRIKDLVSIPIQLTYNTGGIKVADRPGSIGLGWNLEAGGYIEREIRGRCDDGTFTYGGLDSYPLPTFDQWQSLPEFDQNKTNEKFYTGIIDGATDMYSFSIGNKHGKFFFDKQGNFHIMDRQPFKIEKNYTQPSSPMFYRKCTFKITDEEGNEYLFEQAEETSASNLYRHTNSPNCTLETASYWSSDDNIGHVKYDLCRTPSEVRWYITKVKCPRANQEITFNYYVQKYYHEDPNTYINDRSYRVPANSNFYFYASKNDVGVISFSKVLRNYNFNEQDNIEYINPTKEYQDYNYISSDYVVLDNIITPTEKIVFNRSSSYREDVTNEYKTESVEIKDINDVPFKKYVFNQSYFISYEGCLFDQSTCKRLKLNSITETNGSATKPPYVFTYDENHIMYGRDCYKSMDYYGYNCASLEDDNDGMIPSIEYSDPNFNNGTKTIGLNCDRSPTYPDMQSFALTDIIYPSGGKVHFDFEANTYYNLASSINEISGGLRIKAITESCAGSLDVIKNFSYGQKNDPNKSSGCIGDFPLFYKAYECQALLEHYPFSVTYIGVNDKYSDVWLKGSIYPLNDIGSTGGSHLGYSTVTESNPGSGKIVRSFTNFNDRPDEKNTQLKDFWKNKDLSTSYKTIFLNNSKKNDERGLLTSIEYFDNSGNLQKKDTSIYNYNYLQSEFRNENQQIGKNSTIVAGWTCAFNVGSSDDPVYKAFPAPFHPNIDIRWEPYYMNEMPGDVFEGRYYDISKMIKMTSTTESNFSNGNEIKTEKSYTYNSNGFVSSESVTNSDGSISKTYYKYAPDYSSQLNGYDKDDDQLDETSKLIYWYLFTNYNIPKNLLIEKITTKTIAGVEKVVDGHGFTYNYTITMDSQNYPIVHVWLAQEFKLNLQNPIIYSSAFDSHIVPVSGKYTLTFNSNYIMYKSYDSYDANFNLLQYHTYDNAFNVYLWGYKNSLPIAEIKNATYSQVSTALSVLGTDPATIAASATPDMSKIDGLRLALTGSLITTYTYKPLVGIASATNPQGIITNYAYDTFNRLWYMKDNNGNNITNYKYHYNNQ